MSVTQVSTGWQQYKSHNYWTSLEIQISLQHFVARKKCFPTYQTYVASPFFVHALFCLEL